jgi:hypothetical protein
MWLQKIEDGIASLPDREETFINEMSDTYGHLFRKESYGL